MNIGKGLGIGVVMDLGMDLVSEIMGVFKYLWGASWGCFHHTSEHEAPQNLQNQRRAVKFVDLARVDEARWGCVTVGFGFVLGRMLRVRGLGWAAAAIIFIREFSMSV